MEGTFAFSAFIFSNKSALLTKTYLTLASLKMNSNSKGLVVGYTGTNMAPIC